MKAYDETTKETSLGTHYTIKYDVEVSSPDDLVGDIHVLMEGYDKTGTLENGNTIQFDKSKSEFSGRKFKINAVQNIDTLQWFKLKSKVETSPPPPPKKPWKLIIIGVVVAVVVIGVATILLMNTDSAPTAVDFSGNWSNKDPNTGENTRLNIIQSETTVTVHAWGKCTPTDCDWGSETGTITNDIAIIIWDQGFAIRTMIIEKSGNELKVDTTVVYTDGRPSRSSTQTFVLD